MTVLSVKRMWFIGREVGEKWLYIYRYTSTITTAIILTMFHFVSNASYCTLAIIIIHMIHRDNPLEIENAIRVARYLVEPEKVNQHPTIRLFNMYLW